jgi:hypothetical protein
MIRDIMMQLGGTNRKHAFILSFMLSGEFIDKRVLTEKSILPYLKVPRGTDMANIRPPSGFFVPHTAG